jgi:carboxypeptidase C (cathepsin A)
MDTSPVVSAATMDTSPVVSAATMDTSPVVSAATMGSMQIVKEEEDEVNSDDDCSSTMATGGKNDRFILSTVRYILTNVVQSC